VGTRIALVVVIAAILGITAFVAPVQAHPEGLPNLSTTGAASDAPLATELAPLPSALPASGPMVSLGITSEVGTTLGGTLDLGAIVPTTQEQLVVLTLAFQNASRLNSFLQGVSDPSSPSYGQFLTSAQFAQSYSPSLADQLGVADYLTSNGLTIEYLSSDHLTVAAQGTLAQLASTFGVTLAMYQGHGQTYFAPTASPSAPSSLAPFIENIVGLTDHSLGFEPQVLQMHDGGSSGAAAVAGMGDLDYPNQMTYEYQLNQLWNATGNASAGVVPSFAKGVTIATALWDLNTSAYCPYSITDILQFFHGNTSSAPSMPSQLPAPGDHANYQIPGAQTYGPGTGDCTSGVPSPLPGAPPNTASEELSLEMTIDQEYSGEDAPGAMIEPTYVGGLGVTDGVNNSAITLLLAWLAAGNVPGLDVLSQSFGGGESTDFEPYFTELAAEGVTVAASSGDDDGACGFECSGEAVCDAGSPGQYSWNTLGGTTVDYPGSSPNVLSVGGTANMALANATDPGAILPGQTVWNWCPTGGAGGTAGGSTGGVSSLFNEPSFQSGVPVVNRAMQWAMNVTETGNFTNGLPPTGCGNGSAGSGCNDETPATPTARAVPDIAGPAGNMSGYLGGTWVTGWGGTSFSSPSVAGMLGSIMAFDGHRLGFVDPALYSLETGYLAGDFKGLPFNVAPTYYVQNFSNAFFAGASDYNTSSGWGVPQAYNIAVLLGKPFISTNPTGAAVVGHSYPISATVLDDRDLNSVNVTYLEPGGTWANASLALSSGSLNSGTWTGSIPAPTQPGELRYCVDATDIAQGNSWSPYNQSAWAATGGASLNFGCTVPFNVGVHAAYSVTFTEKGLPAGAPWSVTFDGAVASATGKKVVFPGVMNGTYTFSIGTVAGFLSSPASGKLVVAGAAAGRTIQFSTSAGTYPVSFSETGLSPGTNWSVTFNGKSEKSNTPSIVFVGITNGSYAYAVGGISGFVRSPSSGIVVVNGAPPSVSVTFAEKGTGSYTVTFTANGLPHGLTWSVTLHGVTKTGSSSSKTFTKANGAYAFSVQAPAGYSASPSSGSVTVVGANINEVIDFSAPPSNPVRDGSAATDPGGPAAIGLSSIYTNAARPVERVQAPG
jgi:Pro-kumamolisin, activation domain